ncbi:MAG: hypothetical protein M1268_01015 [Patescibacteria group bacterium]|nr:hypothetical protein [Patescibacteria group bacterium]
MKLEFIELLDKTQELPGLAKRSGAGKFIKILFLTSKIQIIKNNIATIGQRTNDKIVINSPDNKSKNNTKSTRITHVLISIPIPIENPTNPCLYSFFHGLKKVLTKSVRENNLSNAELTEAKNEKSDFGASKNQNFKNTIGNNK